MAWDANQVLSRRDQHHQRSHNLHLHNSIISFAGLHPLFNSSNSSAAIRQAHRQITSKTSLVSKVQVVLMASLVVLEPCRATEWVMALHQATTVHRLGKTSHLHPQAPFPLSNRCQLAHLHL